MPNITIENIDEADLRVALWMSNSGKTKKSICEYLKIKYNTTRLTKILTQFQEALANQEVQKKAAKKKIFTDEEKDIIARRYLEVNSMAKVAEEYYVSSARIKAILIEKQVPIKGRKSILVDHIHQDLDTAFSVGSSAFSKIHKSKCLIERKYDESYVEYLKNGSIKTVDNPYVKDDDSRDGVNYYVYWILDDGTNMGLLSSVEALIKSIENTLIKEGQEFYRVKIQNSEGDDYFGFCKRGDLYKI
jgi:hypothetical protein